MILPEEMGSIAFLRNLNESYLQRIAAMARPEQHEAGEVLFCEGEDSPDIYFVLTGEVRLEIEQRGGGPITIYTAGPGEMLGWSPVLGRGPMTATARVSAPCRLAVLDAARILGLCERDPRFGMAFLKQVGVFLSDRLHSTRRCLAFARALPHLSPFALAHEGSD